MSTISESLRGKVASSREGRGGSGSPSREALAARARRSPSPRRREAGAARAAATWPPTAGGCLGLAVDVRDEAQVSSAVAKVESRARRAGHPREQRGRRPLLAGGRHDTGRLAPRHRHESHRRLLLLPRSDPAPAARGGGWIINISSLAGKNTFARGGVYCASKCGLNALSEVLMEELRQDNIRVSYVMPGSVATEFNGRAPAPEDDWKLVARRRRAGRHRPAGAPRAVAAEPRGDSPVPSAAQGLDPARPAPVGRRPPSGAGRSATWRAREAGRAVRYTGRHVAPRRAVPHREAPRARRSRRRLPRAGRAAGPRRRAEGAAGRHQPSLPASATSSSRTPFSPRRSSTPGIARVSTSASTTGSRISRSSSSKGRRSPRVSRRGPLARRRGRADGHRDQRRAGRCARTRRGSSRPQARPT